ncbi:hypothetical protein [Streptomyces caeruleatus]|uniref:Membrane-bound hydrophilic protein n=1 Tax=Streptomyces caeruleatus TaxID=661399 RepID=A0A101U5M3_9ACTN|nr:hypothetical protein [Streptomyces caeruleatus]KUO04720.1 hypothetical protein AQJ67_09395 [Streptomyces caeruleatus]
MPADEVTHGTEVDKSRVRTGPRHAAPKKPLFTRFHMPAGKAIALAAMPTAVLMGMGFTPTLAQADSDNATKPTSNSLTADEYKDCVAALEDDASASPSPSASESTDDDTAEPTPSASAGEDSSDSSGSSESSGTGGSSDSAGDSSSSDSGSDEAAEPTPTPSPSKSSEAQSGDTATASPSPSESGGNLLENIGDAIEDVFTGGNASEESASPTPTPSASASEEASDGSSDAGTDTSKDSDPVKDTAEKATDTVKDTVEEATGKASDTVQDTTEAAKEAADEVTATPSPSASSSADPENCPVATDEEGGVDNPVPLPDEPWYLDASSLLLRGADYKGIVTVKTASGKTKRVLKYVVSDGIDIGDLHQTVKDKQSGKTYHVQAARGSTSTFRDGATVMYTESISGNLLGLIPITFSPDNPPPLNIPLIYFTHVKVVQAGQFGGTLHIPGLHNYMTD